MAVQNVCSQNVSSFCKEINCVDFDEGEEDDNNFIISLEDNGDNDMLHPVTENPICSFSGIAQQECATQATFNSQPNSQHLASLPGTSICNTFCGCNLQLPGTENSLTRESEFTVSPYHPNSCEVLSASKIESLGSHQDSAMTCDKGKHLSQADICSTFSKDGETRHLNFGVSRSRTFSEVDFSVKKFALTDMSMPVHSCTLSGLHNEYSVPIEAHKYTVGEQLVSKAGTEAAIEMPNPNQHCASDLSNILLSSVSHTPYKTLSQAPALSGPYPKITVNEAAGEFDEAEHENCSESCDKISKTDTSQETFKCTCVMCYKGGNNLDHLPVSSPAEPELTEHEIKIINEETSKRKRAKNHERSSKRRKFKVDKNSSVNSETISGRGESVKPKTFDQQWTEVDLPDERTAAADDEAAQFSLQTNVNESELEKISPSVESHLLAERPDLSRWSKTVDLDSELKTNRLSQASQEEQHQRPFSSAPSISDVSKYKMSATKVFLRPTDIQTQRSCLFTTKVPVSSKSSKSTHDAYISHLKLQRPPPLSTISLSTPAMIASPLSVHSSQTDNQTIQMSPGRIILCPNQTTTNNMIGSIPLTQTKFVTLSEAQQMNMNKWPKTKSQGNDKNLIFDSRASTSSDVNSHQLVDVHLMAGVKAGQAFISKTSPKNICASQYGTVESHNSRRIVFQCTPSASLASQTDKTQISPSLKKNVQKTQIFTTLSKDSVNTVSLLRNSEPTQQAVRGVESVLPHSSQTENLCIPCYPTVRTTAQLLTSSQPSRPEVTQTLLCGVKSHFPSSSQNNPEIIISTENRKPISARICGSSQNDKPSPYCKLLTNDNTMKPLPYVSDEHHSKQNETGNSESLKNEIIIPHLPKEGLPSTYVEDWVNHAKDFTSLHLKGDRLLEELRSVDKSISSELLQSGFCNWHALSHHQIVSGSPVLSKCQANNSDTDFTDNSRELLILPRPKNAIHHLSRKSGLTPLEQGQELEKFGQNNISQDQILASTPTLDHSFHFLPYSDQLEGKGNTFHGQTGVEEKSHSKVNPINSFLRWKSVKASSISPSVVPGSKGIKLKIRFNHMKRKRARRKQMLDPVVSVASKMSRDCLQGGDQMSIETTTSCRDEAQNRKNTEPEMSEQVETAEEMFQRFQEQAVQEVFKAQLGVGHLSRNLRPARTSSTHKGSNKLVTKKLKKMKCEGAKEREDFAQMQSLAYKKKSDGLNRKHTSRLFTQETKTKNLNMSARDYPRLKQDNSITNRKKVICSNILAGHKVYVKFNTFENTMSGRSFLVPFFNLGGSRTQFDVEDMGYINKAVIEYEKDEKYCARHLLYNAHVGNKATFLRKENQCQEHHLSEKNYKRSSFILEGFKRDSLKQIEIPSEHWKIDSQVDIEIDRAEVDNDIELEFDAPCIGGNFLGEESVGNENKLSGQSCDRGGHCMEVNGDFEMNVTAECRNINHNKLNEETDLHSHCPVVLTEQVPDIRIFSAKLPGESAEGIPRLHLSSKDAYTEKLQEVIMSENVRSGTNEETLSANFNGSNVLPIEEVNCNSGLKVGASCEDTENFAHVIHIKEEKFNDSSDPKNALVTKTHQRTETSSSILSSSENSILFGDSYHKQSAIRIKEEPYDDDDFELSKVGSCLQFESSDCLSVLPHKQRSGVDTLLLHERNQNTSNSAIAKNLDSRKEIGTEVVNILQDSSVYVSSIINKSGPNCDTRQSTNSPAESDLSFSESPLPSSHVSQSSRISSSSDTEENSVSDSFTTVTMHSALEPSQHPVDGNCHDQHNGAHNKITSLVASLKQRLSQDLPPWLETGNKPKVQTRIGRKTKVSNLQKSEHRNVFEKTSDESCRTADINVDATVQISSCNKEMNVPWTSTVVSLTNKTSESSHSSVTLYCQSQNLQINSTCTTSLSHGSVRLTSSIATPSQMASEASRIKLSVPASLPQCPAVSSPLLMSSQCPEHPCPMETSIATVSRSETVEVPYVTQSETTTQHAPSVTSNMEENTMLKESWRSSAENAILEPPNDKDLCEISKAEENIDHLTSQNFSDRQCSSAKIALSQEPTSNFSHKGIDSYLQKPVRQLPESFFACESQVSNTTSYSDVNSLETKCILIQSNPITVASLVSSENSQIIGASSPCDFDIEVGMDDSPETSLTLSPILPVVDQVTSPAHVMTKTDDELKICKEYGGKTESLKLGSSFPRPLWRERTSYENILPMFSIPKKNVKKQVKQQNCRNLSKCVKKEKGSVAEYLSEKFSSHECYVGHKIKGPRLLHRSSKRNRPFEKQLPQQAAIKGSKLTQTEVAAEPISTIELSKTPSLSEIFGITITDDLLSKSDGGQKEQEKELKKISHAQIAKKGACAERERASSSDNLMSTAFSESQHTIQQLFQKTSDSDMCCLWNLKPCHVVLPRLKHLDVSHVQKEAENCFSSSKSFADSQVPEETLNLRSMNEVSKFSDTKHTAKGGRVLRRKRKRGPKMSRKSGNTNRPKKDIVDYYASVLETLHKKAQQLKEEEARQKEQNVEERKSIHNVCVDKQNESIHHETLVKKEANITIERSVNGSVDSSMPDLNGTRMQTSEESAVCSSFSDDSTKLKAHIDLQVASSVQETVEMEGNIQSGNEKDSNSNNEANTSDTERETMISEINSEIGTHICGEIDSVSRNVEVDLRTSELLLTLTENANKGMKHLEDNCVFQKPVQKIEEKTDDNGIEGANFLVKEKEMFVGDGNDLDKNSGQEVLFEKKDIVLGSGTSDDSVMQASVNEEDADIFSLINSQDLDKDHVDVIPQIEVERLLGLEVSLTMDEPDADSQNVPFTSEIPSDVGSEVNSLGVNDQKLERINSDAELSKCVDNHFQYADSEERAHLLPSFMPNCILKPKTGVSAKAAKILRKLEDTFEKAPQRKGVVEDNDSSESTYLSQADRIPQKDLCESIQYQKKFVPVTDDGFNNNMNGEEMGETYAGTPGTSQKDSSVNSQSKEKRKCNKHSEVSQIQACQLQHDVKFYLRTTRWKNDYDQKEKVDCQDLASQYSEMVLNGDVKQTKSYLSQETLNTCQNVCDSGNISKTESHVETSTVRRCCNIAKPTRMCNEQNKMNETSLSGKPQIITTESEKYSPVPLEHQNDGIFSKLEILHHTQRPSTTCSSEKSDSKRNNFVHILKTKPIDISKLKMKLNPRLACSVEKTKLTEFKNGEVSQQHPEQAKEQKYGSVLPQTDKNRLSETQESECSSHTFATRPCNSKTGDKEGNVSEKVSSSKDSCQMNSSLPFLNTTKLCSILKSFQRNSRDTHKSVTSFSDMSDIAKMQTDFVSADPSMDIKLHLPKMSKNLRRMRTRQQRLPKNVKQESQEKCVKLDLPSQTTSSLSSLEGKKADGISDTKGERSFYDCLSSVILNVWK